VLGPEATGLVLYGTPVGPGAQAEIAARINPIVMRRGQRWIMFRPSGSQNVLSSGDEISLDIGDEGLRAIERLVGQAS